jgi:hypothetical protein
LRCRFSERFTYSLFMFEGLHVDEHDVFEVVLRSQLIGELRVSLTGTANDDLHETFVDRALERASDLESGDPEFGGDFQFALLTVVVPLSDLDRQLLLLCREIAG